MHGLKLRCSDGYWRVDDTISSILGARYRSTLCVITDQRVTISDELRHPVAQGIEQLRVAGAKYHVAKTSGLADIRAEKLEES